jgi:hypothetical protein
VTSYTITITPEDSSATTTTLRLDTSGGHVTLTDLHLHASDGLPTGAVAGIDYGLLLQAITPRQPTPVSTAPAATPIEATPGRAAKAARAARPSTPAKTTRTRRTPAEKASAAAQTEPATKPRGRRATGSTRTGTQPVGTTAGTTAKTAPAKKAVAGEPATGQRAYRRMPEDFATVYQQAGSTAAVVDHYGVPRHTVHGWIRRLRGQ